MNQPPPSDSRAALEAIAIRYLSYRSRFKVEVIDRLARKAREIGLTDPFTLINQIVESLEKSGFINDTKNLEDFIRYRLETKLKGSLWIRAYLIHLGLAKSEIEAALRRHAPAEIQRIAIGRFLSKKLGSRRPDIKTKAKLFRALVNRGFPVSLVASAFDGKDSGEV